MHKMQLEEATITFGNIFLDPNNPRFWTEKSGRDVPDKKIPDDGVQARAAKSIESHGIQELFHSILRNGFLPLDRIVVRPIEGHKGKYVVVEGNRRVAALQILRQRIKEGTIDEPDVDQGRLDSLVTATDELDVLVYNGEDKDEIAWLLQGVRHISGIRNWKPAQQGRLVADQIEKHGLRLREAGQQFGLSAQAVGRLYRAYKGLEQMRRDDEFQAKALNEYFTLFEEAIRNKQVKEWLEWDDEASEFQNEENLRQFYSWITPDDGHVSSARRIHDPRHIKSLGFLIAGGHDDLLAQIDAHEIGIEGAYDRAVRKDDATDWKLMIQKAAELVGSIPQIALQQGSKEVRAELAQLEGQIENLKKMLAAVSDQ